MTDLTALLTAAGAVKTGIAPLDSAVAARIFGETGTSAPFFAVCAAFSYLAEDIHAQISRYARGTDYHAVLKNRLEPAVQYLRQQGCHAESMADISPLSEVSLAVSCGVGVRGKNGLLIIPDVGSWLFLGFLVTDAPLIPTEPLYPSECLGCRACIRDCPTGALSDAGVDPLLCLSAVTQRKGDLTAREEALMRETETLWGCDLCQEACPMNYGVPLTEIPEFRENLIRTLTPEALENVSNRTLSERFPNRAFTWRGANVLKRNAAVLNGKT